MPTRRRHLGGSLFAAGGVVMFAAGAVVMVAGTFAPWLRSGDTTRNSYRTAGLLQRLLGVDGFAGTALDALPLLAVIWAALLALIILGWTRTALLIGCGLAVAMAALSLAAVTAPSAHGVRAARSGPMITFVGCALIVTAAVGVAQRRRADRTLRKYRAVPTAPAPENPHERPD